MAEFQETQTYTVTCPACQSDKVVKAGQQAGQQRYRCKRCEKWFRANGKAPGRKVDAEIMGAAVEDYFRGKSYKAIAEGLSREYDIPEPSKATIYEWVRDYSEKAVDQMDGAAIQTGDHWVADEMMVKVGGGKAWLWNVMDGETRYILATHLSRERDGRAARAVLSKALKTAGKPPDAFFSDKLRSYLPALKSVLPDAKHYQSEGLTADINNNLSERLQGTFRDRVKTLRGLDSLESGQRYLDGWTLNYNMFREHESLRDRTPAQVAKVEVPFTEWADVVRGTQTARRNVVSREPPPKLKPLQRAKPKVAPHNLPMHKSRPVKSRRRKAA